MTDIMQIIIRATEVAPYKAISEILRRIPKSTIPIRSMNLREKESPSENIEGILNRFPTIIPRTIENITVDIGLLGYPSIVSPIYRLRKSEIKNITTANKKPGTMMERRFT